MKLKHLFTALLLLCCTIATAEEVTIDGIKYDVVTKAKVATVIAGGSYSGDIVIPSEITHNDVVCSVTSIGDGAFSGCSGLASVTIPNSVTSIGVAAFYDCKGLTSIKIPNSVTTIGNSTFERCSKLTSVTIPNSVTSIGEDAFTFCYRLKSITIPNSVTSIGQSAFSYCYGLESITIPSSVTSIGDDAFSDCTGLTSVNISDLSTWCNINFNKISSNPLNYAENLYLNGEKVTELVIPDGVSEIKAYAFGGCSGLTSVTIPNSVTIIGDFAFSGCSGLTSVTIPNSVTIIGFNAFKGCSGLTSITIPNSVTIIWYSIFDGCSGLTNITIGSGVKNIYEQAFANCSELANVYCLATTVPSTVESAFENSYPEYMTLHVPAEAINDYKTTAPWSSFGTIVTFDGEEVETPKCATPVISYENGQLLVTCDTDGAEFVTEITNSYVNKYYDSAIDLTATYNISTYATLAGYDNSDIVNATLFWVENGSSDNETDVINIPATVVLVTSNNGAIYINGALDGENVAVYTTAGVLIGGTTITNGNATVQSGLEKGSVAVVKVGERAVKVVVD